MLAAIRVDLKKRGKGLAGRDRVLQCSREKRGSHPVRLRNPRFATRDRKLLSNAISDERCFEMEHAKAKERYLAGHRKVVFPRGTYGYRELFRVRVAKQENAA